MGQVIIIIGLVASLITIFFGISAFVKNRKGFKDTLADWTRRKRKAIYFVVSHGKQGDFTLYLSLCGEETSLFYPSTYENCEPYILAMKQIHYDTSYPSNSDRYYSEWTAMFVKPLSEDEYPHVVELIGECRFRFRLPNDNGESITVFDAFKFKTELKECLKKCEIKYYKKAPNPQDRWKAKDK